MIELSNDNCRWTSENVRTSECLAAFRGADLGKIFLLEDDPELTAFVVMSSLSQ